VQPEPASAAADDVLALLVKLTLNGDLLQTVRQAKAAARVAANPQGPSEQALKDAVAKALAAAGAIVQPNLDFAVIREAVADYCDRVVVGVDSWDANDQLQWKAVCNEVTDAISSVI
jgi:hypothetical protein